MSWKINTLPSSITIEICTEPTELDDGPDPWQRRPNLDKRHKQRQLKIVVDLLLISRSYLIIEKAKHQIMKVHMDVRLHFVLQLRVCGYVSGHTMDRKVTTAMMCMNCLQIQPVGPICSTPSGKWTYDGKILSNWSGRLISISGGNMAMGGMEGDIKAKLKKTRKSIKGDKRCYLYGKPSPWNSKFDLSYEEPT
ncbi:hypothetical protein Tco_1121353 [Tanacetum coccineum]|uniref:Uncharacterized protein n=1 Tax=Tanacetum coccineum TaxID=301880 RepID=A0ABQ5J0E0_9ASTR